MPALTAFSRPVTVYVGLGFPRQVDDAEEAFMLLNEMPSTQRGAAHGAALKACRAAMTGEVDADTARGVFEAFAKARGRRAASLPMKRSPIWRWQQSAIYSVPDASTPH